MMPQVNRGTRRAGQVAASRTGNPAIDRPSAQQATQLNRLLQLPLTEAVMVQAGLVSGINKVGHGMGRPVRHFVVAAVPTGATVTSAQADNPNPERSVWVELAGAATADVLLILLPVT